MLSESKFQDWCRKNYISRKAKTVIERIRASEPSRRVRSGSQSVSGTFPSRKMGLTIQYESHKNELPFVYELEHDPEVLEFYDQPFSIKLNYIGKNNRNLGVMHTSDFFVIKMDSAGWVECKTEEDLLKLAVKQQNRYRLDENEQWICPPGNEYANQFDLTYSVRSCKQINWFFQRNFEFLDDYYRKKYLKISDEAGSKIFEIVRNEPGIFLETLLEKIRDQESIMADDIYSLIAAGEIYVDLQSFLLTEPENARVFISQEASAAYANIFRPANSAEDTMFRPKSINITPNTEILWDGKAWKIMNVGNCTVSLINEAEDLVPVPVDILKRLVINGDIEEISNFSHEANCSRINEILINAKDAELKIANYRAGIVRADLNP